MHRRFLPLALVAGLGLQADASASATGPRADTPARSARNANYVMDVRLDPDARILHGTTDLSWTNIASSSTQELRFHLYYNAWRNTESSFLRSVRYHDFDWSDYESDDWAYSRIEHMQIASAGDHIDLTDELEYVHPDDDNDRDRTVVRVKLPEPVEPGETVEIHYRWQAKVPRTFARTGVRDDYYFLAQWFPKIGVFEDGAWNCHQFIQTEFYADFGVYDVTLTVPEGWIVGATGREIEQTDNDDQTTSHRYYQTDVHDFTWTASPHFSVHTDRFEHSNLPSVDLELLLMPDHRDMEDRYFEATKAALEHYGSWWGPYPYGHLTIVDPAYRSGSGGMEYPTLFTGGTHWLSPPASRSPESVTVHECGHQFWYGIVANNEFEHAWMDEGFNSYTQARTMERVYPDPRYVKRYFHGFLPVVFEDLVLRERDAGADRYGGSESTWVRDPIARASWTYGPGSYGINSYNKPAMMLRTLEHLLGWETFRRAVSTFFQRWKFRHPSPEDFFAILEQVAGTDLDWFVDQVYGGTAVFDYAVGQVESDAIGEPHGYVATDDGLEFRTGDDDDEQPRYRSTVVVRRWGDGVFPVDVVVRFSDGHEVRERWDGQDRWTRYRYQRPARVERVTVDPEHKLVLDVDYTNNSWMRESQADIASTKWTAKWLFEVQYLMELLAFFA